MDKTPSKIIYKQRRGKLGDAFTDPCEAVAELLGKAGRHDLALLSLEPTKHFRMDIDSGGFFSGAPLANVQYSGEDAVQKLAKGYLSWARVTGLLVTTNPEKPLAYNDHGYWPDSQRLTFQRRFASPFGPINYSVSVDNTGLTGDRLEYEGEARDKKLVSIVADIAEGSQRPLDGYVARTVSREALQAEYKRDLAKVRDAALNLGFAWYGTQPPGNTDDTGLYNVCLEPMIVDEDGLATFLDKALSLGLEAGWSQQQWKNFSRAGVSVNIKRDGGRDFLSMTLSGRNYDAFCELAKEGFQVAGIETYGREAREFLGMKAEYDERLENPAWSRYLIDQKADRQLALRGFWQGFGRATRSTGRGLLKAGKWGTVPVWGGGYLLYKLGERGINAGLEANRRRIEERKRVYDTISSHLEELGVPKNKRIGPKSCVIGVSPEYVASVKQELADQEVEKDD
ncbi:MAG: hypothetical protein JSW08_00685 [archaeon]|nr:MAG: hypothetical protein JSW08_00685 [archaeon]